MKVKTANADIEIGPRRGWGEWAARRGRAIAKPRRCKAAQKLTAPKCEDCGVRGGHAPNCGREPTYDNREI